MESSMAVKLEEPLPREPGNSESDDDELADELEAELFEAEAKRDLLGDSKRPRNETGSPAGERHSKAPRVEEKPSGLAALPVELLSLVLAWLSPDDLAQVSRTCRALRRPTWDETLWRRLYCSRFGHPKQHEKRGGASRRGGSGVRGTWRSMYYLEDAREMRQATEGQGELRHIFAEMQAAKRSQAPDAASLHTDDAIISTPTDAEAVARWRASKGLGDGTDLRSRHTCSLESGCSFHRVGADVFVCEATGRAHVCDDDCRERVVDMDGMSEMCSISGRSFDRILEEGAEGMTGVAGGAAAYGVGDPTGERGWLGRCFEAGYGASSRREMYETLWGGGGARDASDSDESES